MAFIYAILIILIVGGIGTITYIVYYNALQDCKVKIDEAESMIDEALRSKYDILLKLESIIKNNIKETKINFKDLNDLKKESISNFQLERKLVDTVLLISKIQDDFPELEEQKDYRELLNDIRVMDERINASKKFYNKYTSKSNELVRKFPSNIIAKFHNITIRNFFSMSLEFHPNIFIFTIYKIIVSKKYFYKVNILLADNLEIISNIFYITMLIVIHNMNVIRGCYIKNQIF